MVARKSNLLPETEAAFRSLIRTVGLLKRVMEPYFARFGVSGSQWGVLRTLHRAEREGLTSVRLTDLASRLLIRPPSVTGVIDRLQRMGLVARTAADDDLRVKHVTLTAQGRQIVARVLEHHAARINAVMAGLQSSEQGDLHRLLEKTVSHLETLAVQEETQTADADE